MSSLIKSWLVLGLIFGSFIVVSPYCHAENCPWLNAATAGGVLGGTVVARLTHTTPENMTCDYTLEREGSKSSLKIAVRTSSTSQKDFQNARSSCGATSTPLRGIGNEAVECTLSEMAGYSTEQIIGRVRDRVFILKWSARKTGDRSHAEDLDGSESIIRNVAEQIAGSLF
ncbi:hypothetical protein [Acidicapsa ligni]|uniref:hypothetical protein n=1 Tax=Acidicapsa ligni TaxID=542300 RepID=UPI0021E0980C|nr:hypothetical protein [Acidicapsa ligni]